MNYTQPLTIENPTGRLDYCISFQEGLPGFNSLESFRLFKLEDNSETPLFWEMQSLDEPSISFILMPLPTGNIQLPEEDFSAFVKENDVDMTTCKIYAITAFEKDLTGKVQVQINLKAPIVVDTLTGSAWQVILPKGYPLDYTIAEL